MGGSFLLYNRLVLYTLTVQLVHGGDVVRGQGEGGAPVLCVVGVHDRLLVGGVCQAQAVSNLVHRH